MQQIIGVILLVIGVFRLVYILYNKQPTEGIELMYTVRRFGSVIATIILGLIFLLDL